MRASVRVVVSLSLFVICLALPLAAQEAISQGSIAGRVLDAQAAAVPGAVVRVRHTETGVAVEATTGQDGRFRFAYLRVGPYELTVRLQGFRDVTRTLAVGAGSAFDVPITLEVGGLDTTVTVTADALPLETARSQIAGTVPQAEVQNLPMNGRNFLDLALLVPGVSPTGLNSTQLFAETSGVPGGGLSIASQRNLSNSFIVDGMSANDDAAGLAGITFGVDAIEQFQVVTGGGQAELGRALGGYVNVVTRSGTNTRRGTMYGFFRDDTFNGENALTGTKLPMDQQQFGGSLGGPVARNRTFYFANVERKLLDQTGVTTITEANAAAINARLDQVGFPGQRVQTGIYPNPIHSTNVLGKVDHQISGADQLTVRYALYDVVSRNARGAGTLNAPSGSTGIDNLDQAFSVSNVLTLSPNTLNETRVQVTKSDLQAYSTDIVGPQVTISGVATFGTFSSSPTRRENTMVQVVNNLSHRAGAHALRAGVDVLYNDDTITFLRTFRGSYSFSSLANFLAGTYNSYSQTFGNPVVNQTNPNVGFYAQDEWRASSRLTVNAGLRYDLQFLDTIITDTNNVSPRLGFAWTPGDTSSLVVRGGAGVFFDRVPLRAVANGLLSAGNTTDVTQLRQPQVAGLLPAQAGAPVFPNMLPDRLPSTALVSITTIDRNLQNAYSRQANVEVGALARREPAGHGRVPILPRREPADEHQPERRDLRGGGHQQRLPAGVRLPEPQPVQRRRVVQLPRPACHLPATAARLVVGACGLHAVEVDEQPRRGLLQPADGSDECHEGLGPLGQRPAPSSGRQRVGHRRRVPGQRDGAVLLGAAVQHRVGRQQPAGHWRPAAGGWQCIGGELRRAGGGVHPAQRRRGQQLLQPRAARQPDVHPARRCADRGADRSLQPDQHAEHRDPQHDVRHRVVSVESAGSVQHGDGGRRSADVTVRRAGVVLNEVS